MDEQRIKDLRAKVDTRRDEVQRAKGALEQVLATLQTEFGCSSLEEAESKLEELRAEEEKTGKALDRAVEAFEGKWHEKLA